MDTPTVPFSTPQDPYGKGRPPFHSAREPQRWWEKTWVILLTSAVLPLGGIALTSCAETDEPSQKETTTTQPITTSATTSTTTITTRASDIYYKSCAQVRAAGKAPLYRGDPGYRPGLDQDNDGVACEV